MRLPELTHNRSGSADASSAAPAQLAAAQLAARCQLSAERRRSVSVLKMVSPSQDLQAALEKREVARRIDLRHADKTTYTERLLIRAMYKFDEIIAERKWQIITLMVVLVLQIVFGGIFYSAASQETVLESMWLCWTYLTDPGTMASVPPDGPERFVASVVTVCGIFFFAFILGFVVDGVLNKMSDLKKGTSMVVESGHTVLLGWSDKSTSVIREVLLANASETESTAEHSNVIVVLAQVDKQLLEAEIAEQISPSELQFTKIVCRTGSPLHAYDLLKVSCQTARSIIVLSQSGDPDRADATTLRIVLTLKGLKRELNGHIVAEIQDIDNEPLVQLVGGTSVETVVSHDMIGRLLLVSMHEPGLAKVYRTTLGYEGHEFYAAEWPELVGVSFSEVMCRIPNAIPIGIRTLNGSIILKPPRERKIMPGEELVVLAEDNDTYGVEEPQEVHDSAPPPVMPKRTDPHIILICGFRRDIRDIIKQFDAMLPAGSQVHLVNEVPLDVRETLLEEGGLDINSLENVQLVHYFANTANRRHLEQLPLHVYTGGMILGNQSLEQEPMNSDSHSLATLLTIRELQLKGEDVKSNFRRSSTGRHKLLSFVTLLGNQQGQAVKIPMVCEILDSRTQQNVEMIEVLSIAGDFVRSNEMVSQVLAMVSEDRGVRRILGELLGPEGCKLSVKPSIHYARFGERLTFWQLAKRVEAFDEILCGYVLEGGKGEPVMNPEDKHMFRVWDGCDVVVLTGKSLGVAEDPTLRAVRALQKRSDAAVKGAEKLNRTLETTRSRRRSLVEASGAEDLAAMAKVAAAKEGDGGVGRGVPLRPRKSCMSFTPALLMSETIAEGDEEGEESEAGTPGRGSADSGQVDELKALEEELAVEDVGDDDKLDQLLSEAEAEVGENGTDEGDLREQLRRLEAKQAKFIADVRVLVQQKLADKR